MLLLQKIVITKRAIFVHTETERDFRVYHLSAQAMSAVLAVLAVAVLAVHAIMLHVGLQNIYGRHLESINTEMVLVAQKNIYQLIVSKTACN